MENEFKNPVSSGTPTDAKKVDSTINDPFDPPKKGGFRFGEKALKTSSGLMGSGIDDETRVKDFGKYEKYLGHSGTISAPVETWETARALKQSNWEQVANAGARVLFNVLPEIVKQGSNMLDFDDDFSSDNKLGGIMQELQDANNERFQIFRENPTEALNFGDFAYWAEQGSSLVTSALAFAALGYATGGVAGAGFGAVAKGAQLARGAVAGSRAGQAIEAGVAAANVGTRGALAESTISAGKTVADAMKKVITTRNAAGLTNAYLLNKAEGVGLAIDTYQSVKEKTFTDLKSKQKESGLTDAQIVTASEKEAANAAAFAYSYNKANILLNITSAFAFVKPGVAAFRQNLVKTGMRNTLLGVGREAAQEYGEETINFLAQKRAEQGDANLSFSDQLMSTIDNTLGDMTSAEGFEAGFWGAMGGMAQTGFTKAGHHINMYNNSMYDTVLKTNIGKLSQDPTLTNEEIGKKAKELTEAQVGPRDKKVSINRINEYKNAILTEERAKIDLNFTSENDPDGVKYDNAKLKMDLFFDTNEQLKLDDEIRKAEAREDYEEVARLSERKFDSQVMKAMQTGTLNTLEENLEAVKDLSVEDAMKAGLAKDKNDMAYKQKANKGLEDIRNFEKFAINNSKYINSEFVNTIDNALYRIAEREEKLQKELQPILTAKQYEKKKAFGQRYNTGDVDTIYYTGTPDQQEDYLRNVAKNEGQAQRTLIGEQIKSMEANYDLEAKDFENDPENQAKFEFLSYLKEQKEDLTKEREIAVSPKTQQELNDAHAEAVNQARQEAYKAKQEAKQDAKNKKKAKDISTKESDDLKNKKDTSKDTAPKKDPPVAPPADPVIEDVTDKDPNDPPAPKPKPKAKPKPKSSVPFEAMTVIDLAESFDAFFEKTKSKLSPEAIKTLENFRKTINAVDKVINHGQKVNNVAAFRTKIEFYLTGKEGKAIDIFNNFERNNLIRAEVAAYYDTLYRLGSDALNLIESSQEVVEVAAAATDAEFASPETDDDTADLEEETGEVSEDIGISVMSQQALDEAANLSKNFIDLLRLFESLGLPINSYEEFELRMYRFTDEATVLKARPTMIRAWNAMADIMQNPSLKVEEDFHRVNPINAMDALHKDLEANDWDDNKQKQVKQQANKMLDGASNLDGNFPSRVQFGSPRKITSSLTAAYLGMNYEIETSYEQGEKIEKFKDTNLNDDVDPRLLDRDAFPDGTKVYFRPLKINEKHSYIDKKKKVEVVITRISKDEVLIRHIDSNGVTVNEFKDSAINSLPIFISTSKTEKGHIKGLFVRVPGTFTQDRFGGDVAQFEAAKGILVETRENIINSKTILSAEVAGVSLGTLLKGESKTVNEVDPNAKTKPVIAILDPTGALKSNRQKGEDVINRESLKDFRKGTPFMVVKHADSMLAIPVSRRKLKDMQQGKAITDSLVRVINTSLKYQQDWNEEDELIADSMASMGYNIKKMTDVKDYIANFLYINDFQTENFEQYTDFVKNNTKNKPAGSSALKFSYFEDRDQAGIVFGTYGGSEMFMLDRKIEDREKLLSNLRQVIENAYMHIDIGRTTSKKKIGIINDDLRVEYIADNYTTFIGDNLYTNAAPQVIPSGKKTKTIYTVQHTIGFTPPSPSNKKAEAPVIKTTEDVKEEQVEEVETEVEVEVEEDSYFDEEFDAPETDRDMADEGDEGDEGGSAEQYLEETFAVISLKEDYNFIEGVNTNLLHAVISNMKAFIEDTLVNDSMVSKEDAFNFIMAKIEKFEALGRSEVAKADTDKKREIRTNNLNKTIAAKNALISQKDKVMAKFDTVIKRQGFFEKATTEQIAEKNKQLKEEKRLQLEEEAKAATARGEFLEEQEANDNTSDADNIDVDETDNDTTSNDAINNVETNEETKEYMQFDKDSSLVNVFDTFDKQIKSFFSRVRVMEKVNDKVRATRNMFGLDSYVEPIEVFRAVQELLANYHNSEPVPANFESYLARIKQEARTKPFLTDVVEKLEAVTDESFKNAFVKSMYKQYNNTFIVISTSKGTSRVVGIDTSSVNRAFKDEWMSNVLSTRSSLIVGINDENPSIKFTSNVYDLLHKADTFIEQEFAKKENDRKYVLPLSLMADTMINAYKLIGIEMPTEFKMHLLNNMLPYRGEEMGFKYFYNTIFKYNMASIAGDLPLGFRRNDNFLATDLFHNSSFNKLATMLHKYNANMYSSSSKDINNKTVFNYSEVKNLVDSFLKNKHNEEWINEVMKDPFRNIGIHDENAKYKTWAQQLFTYEGNGKYSINKKSFFYESFEYLTFNGTEFQSNKGKERVAVDNLSELGHIKTQFNIFFSGNIREGNREKVRHGYLPFLTMSDKKVPMYFKAPLYDIAMESLRSGTANKVREAFLKGETVRKNRTLKQEEAYLREVDRVRKLVNDTFIAPEVNRILELFDNTSNINIKGYNKEYLKFYGLPILNTINFDYANGLNGKKDDTLRKKLGLVNGEQLFDFDIESGEPMMINPDVLRNDKVRDYLIDIVNIHINNEYNKTIKELSEAEIVKSDGENGIVFNKNSGIDLELIVKSYRGHNEKKANRVAIDDGDAIDYTNIKANIPIFDYVFNTMAGFANMQQMLVGDFIQFADNKTSDKIFEKIKENKLKLARPVISPEDTLKLQEEQAILIEQYKEAWALLDVENTYNNEGKRLAGDNASGEIILPGNKTHFNLLIVKDLEMDSIHLEDYRKMFLSALPAVMGNGVVVKDLLSYKGEDFANNIDSLVFSKSLTEDEGNTIKGAYAMADGYSKINTADAQELTTLAEHLDILVAQSKFTRQRANQILADDNKGVLNMKDYNDILTSMKLVYSNSFLRDGVSSRLYIKSSSFPLARTFTKGLPIDKVVDFMEKNKIDRIAFESAIKVGGVKKAAPLFNEDGSINIEGVDIKKHMIPVPRVGHKKQQNVPYDEDKTKISDGTQKSKLIFLNLMQTEGFIDPVTGDSVSGRKLHDNYIKLFDEYYKRKYFTLKDKITKNNKLNYEMLHRLLYDEAISRGYSENDMQFLKLNQNKDGFEYPIWLSSNQGKIEALLNSIVDNNIRKRKRRGMSKVLVSDAILDITKRTDSKKSVSSNVTFIDPNRTEPLRPMRQDPETGKWLPAEIVITMPFRDNYGRPLDIKDFMNEDGTLDVSKLPEELLESVAFRIPTQGINSMSLVKIVGFLPPSVDNVVFAPRDFVAQMGSDFDVDKLYGDLQNTIYENGALRKITQEDADNIKAATSYMKVERRINNIKKELEKYRDGASFKKEREAAHKNLRFAAQESETILKDRDRGYLISLYNSGVKDMHIKHYENLLLDYHKAILLNPSPDVQLQRIQPIDSAEMLTIKNSITPALNKEKTSTSFSPYSPTYQIKKYVGARSGKTGVSSSSSDSVLNAVLQSVRNSMHFTTKDGDGKIITQSFKLFGHSSNALNNPKNVKGGYKSDTIQAIQSIAVDNEKLQLMDKLNLNKYTFDFVRAAGQLGFDAEIIFYMINHPIVKDFVKKADNGIKFTEPASITNAFSYLGEYSMTDFKRLVSNGESTAKLDAAVYTMFKTLTNKGKILKNVESVLNLDSNGFGSNMFFSLEKEEAINNINDSLSITNIHKVIGEYRPMFDHTTEGAKLALNKSNSKEDLQAYNDAKEANDKKNVDKGFMTISGRGSWFKPSTIAGAVSWYGLRYNNHLWGNILPYKNDAIREVTSTVERLNRRKSDDIFLTATENRDLKQRVDLSNDVPAGSTNAKNSDASVTINAIAEGKARALKEYKAFLYSGSTMLLGRTATEARQELISSSKLAEIIKSLQRDPGVLKHNRFIKKLSFTSLSGDMKDGTNGMLNPIFNASSAETFDEDHLVYDVIDILESVDSVTIHPLEGESYELPIKELGEMLVLHQLSIGATQEAIQFIKHIPPGYLKNLGVYNYIKDEVFYNHRSNVFYEQYVQHNPKLVLSEFISNDINGASTEFTQDPVSGYIYSNRVISDNTRLEEGYAEVPFGDSTYFSILNSAGEAVLYKQSAMNKGVFIPIDTLGKSRIREYDASATGTIKSMFSDNSHGFYEESNEVKAELDNKNILLHTITTEIASLMEMPDSERGIVKKCD